MHETLTRKCVWNVRKEVYHMYDMMKGMTGAARLSGGTMGLSMRRSVRGRSETFGVEPLTLAPAARRSASRVAAAGRMSGARCCGARRSQRMM